MRFISIAKIAFGAAALVAALPASANLVSNGGFEDPAISGNFTTYGASSTLGAWTVDSGSIDLIHSYWQPSEGEQSIDLDGNEAASISQVVNVPSAGNYTLSFDMSGNVDGGPSVKALDVLFNGNWVGTATYDTAAEGNSFGNMKYEAKSIGLNGLGAGAGLLQLVSTSPGYFGAAVDNVKMEAVPEPCSIAALGLGVLGLVRRRRASK